MASASVPDISGFIHAARTFLVRQAGLLDATLELESFQEKENLIVIVFRHYSFLYGPSRWTVDMDRISGKVVKFDKQIEKARRNP
jgi:hypothetical protein